MKFKVGDIIHKMSESREGTFIGHPTKYEVSRITGTNYTLMSVLPDMCGDHLFVVEPISDVDANYQLCLESVEAPTRSDADLIAADKYRNRYVNGTLVIHDNQLCVVRDFYQENGAFFYRIAHKESGILYDVHDHHITLPGPQKGTGERHNRGKLAMHQCPEGIKLAVARVFQYNSKKWGGKYENYNWRLGQKWSIPIDSFERHWSLWKTGEELDDESLLPHLEHAAANLAMLIEYAKTYREGDDRYKYDQVTLKDYTSN